MNTEVFEKLSPAKLFFRCAIPAMISSVFGALYSVVDGIFVGRFVGEDALAAVNLMMPVLMMITAAANMIATGSSVHISVLLGQKKREEASRVFSFSVKVILLLSCIIAVIGIIFAEPIVRMLAPGATEEAIGYCITYLRVYAFFAPLLPIFFATDNYLRVCGKEKLSMGVNVVTQLLNVVLDVILIGFCGQGVWAAAFTSCISMALGSVFTLVIFTGKRLDVYYTRGKISLSVFSRIIANGSSEFFNSISMSVMSLVLNLFLLHYGGTTAVAAMSVVMYVDSIVGMLLFGMCDAIQPAVSYCYGAGNIPKVKALFLRVVSAAVILSVFSFLFLRYIGQFAAPFFVSPGDTALLEMSIGAMRIFAFSYLPGWIDMCFSSFFTALERPVRSLLVSLFGTLVFPVAFLFILGGFWNLDGIWWMPTAAGTASGLFTVILARTMKIRKKAEQ